MENLALVVKYYGEKNGIDINFFEDVSIVNDPEGLRIEKWNISNFLKPSMEELGSLEPEAMLYYARQTC